MKKIFALATSGATYFTLATSAFATDLCPNQFANLCNLQQDPSQLVGKFITIALIIAIIACLFFLIYGGIRWITSGGDEKQVEAAKSHVVAAIVGLVIALAAWFILQFLGTFFGVDLLHFNIPNLTVSP